MIPEGNPWVPLLSHPKLLSSVGGAVLQVVEGHGVLVGVSSCPLHRVLAAEPIDRLEERRTPPQREAAVLEVRRERRAGTSRSPNHVVLEERRAVRAVRLDQQAVQLEDEDVLMALVYFAWRVWS